jgi:serine/threonine protein kinase
MKAIGIYLIEKDPIGKGQFGSVFRAHLKGDTSKKFAVKVIVKKTLTKRLFQNLNNEISILSKINCP